MKPRRTAGRLRSCRGDDHLFELVVVEGHAPPEAAPEHLTVAEITRTATGPAAPSELTDEPAVRAAFTAVRTRELSRRPHRRGRHPSSGALIARGMSMTAAALLAATGVAAAATGNLPASAQEPLSHSLANIGISIPEPPPTKPQQAADAPAETSTYIGHSTARAGRTSPTPDPTTAVARTAPAAVSPADSIPPAAPASPPDAAPGTVTLTRPPPTVTSAAPVTTTTAPVVDASPYPVTTSPPDAVTTTTAAPPTSTTVPADPTTTTVPPAHGMSTGNASAGPVTAAPTLVSSQGSASLP